MNNIKNIDSSFHILPLKLLFSFCETDLKKKIV